MLGDQLVLHDDVGARRADVAGRTIAPAAAAQELDFDRDREVLVLPHGLRRLAVDHGAAVAKGPARTARTLFPDETIFEPQLVMGKSTLVKEVAKLAVKL